MAKIAANNKKTAKVVTKKVTKNSKVTEASKAKKVAKVDEVKQVEKPKAIAKPLKAVVTKEAVKPAKSVKVIKEVKVEKTKKIVELKKAEEPKKAPKVVKVAKPKTETTTSKKTEQISIKNIDTSSKIDIQATIKKVAKQNVSNSANTSAVEEKQLISKIKKVVFQLKYSTTYGQELLITGNDEIFGNNDISKAITLQYFNDSFWYAEIEFEQYKNYNKDITYNYVLKNLDNTIQYDCGNDKVINFSKINVNELLILDSWNYTGYVQNTFYTEPFKNILLKKEKSAAIFPPTVYTHFFKTKTPFLNADETLCIVGSGSGLNKWDKENPVLMRLSEDSEHYVAYADLSNDSFPVAYKYCVYNNKSKSFVRFEEGDNRVIFDIVKQNKQTIINDAFANLPINNWRGSGVAIPVFSLKTKNSFGVGEFTDIEALVDWSESIGLKLIQILPINDTTANHTWQDSYPYAAISAFALHPIYINLKKATSTENIGLYDKLLVTKQEQLNSIDSVDYEAVMKAKIAYLQSIYKLQGKKTFEEKAFTEFFNNNKHWLVPYSCFCYLRDEYKTPNYNEWPAFKVFNQKDIDELTAKNSAALDDISFHYFVQYHLHLQLLEATEYAHSKGIIVKGDIPIGIYRYGADAWQEPSLYNMNVQAGAPPDDFAIKGQNWGFPTYNWQAMQQDGFGWWKKRFEQMRFYFDAFRIDHILGFFRIWSIPLHAVEGIMGYFVPAIPLHINEIFSRNISFDLQRFTKPYITDSILWQEFGYDNEQIKNDFLTYDGYGNYTLKTEFNTQKAVEKHFNSLELNDLNSKLKLGLYNLISNVILFEVEGTNAQQFHFRFNTESTSSFQNLDFYTQQQLKELYVDYFFRRQDDFWYKEAMQKLPALRRTTNMLICGEDLGLVPGCVPDVMKQLGLLSLEIQRMPKANDKPFFHPADAPYLSVVTPSTHDMSVIRGWWEEDYNSTQRFFNNELGQFGEAPFFCNGWVNKAIVIQHLYSPAMWAIFQLQDLMGMDEEIRRENPNDERINVPANPNHYWRYRMNMTIEELMEKNDFNKMLSETISMSGR